MEDKEKALEQLLAKSRQWQEFVGIKNSKDAVLIKASALASVLASQQAVWSVEALQSLQLSGVSFGISKTDRRWWDVYYDHLLYYMHIADREAYEFLGERRGIFVDRLVEEVGRICRGNFEDDKQAAMFTAQFPKIFNQFQNEFASYERVASVPLGEQLQYRFSKRIANRLDLGPEFGLLVAKGLTAGEILLNIPGLLTGKSWAKGKGL